MRNIFLVLILTFICFGSSTICKAQKIKIEQQESKPFIFDMYQLFLDFEIQSIQKLEYEKEAKPLKGHLDSDKSSIVLDNYDGKSRVKVTCTDFYGKTHEIIKSKCFIDPYVPL